MRALQILPVILTVATMEDTLLHVMLWPLLALRRWYLQRRSRPCENVVKNLQSLLRPDPVLWVEELDAEFRIGAKSDIFARLVRFGRYEPGLVVAVEADFDRTKDGIDVGANVGFYSVLMAKLLDEGQVVLACEPARMPFEMLHENVERNHVAEKVLLRNIALSDASGCAALRKLPGKEEYSSLGRCLHVARSAGAT